MSHRRGPLVSSWVVALVALLVAVSACSAPEPEPDTPAPAASVQLTADVPDGLSIGVLVSVTSAPGEGGQWRDPAEGTRVAASRFALGRTNVRLVPVNDKGTAAGASAAVRTLAAQGVAGIVLATSGRHLDGALQEAAERGLPVLLPYATTTNGLPAHAWLTGVDTTVADQRIVQALQQQGLRRPYVIDAGGGDVDGLTPVGSADFSPGGDADDLARSLAARRTGSKNAFDALVVSGPAVLQGRLVAALQGAGIDTTVLLSADALSPTFPQAIDQAGGSLAGTLVTAGLDGGDAEALQPTGAGRAAAAYFSALNMLSADAKATDLFGQRPFSTVAGSADLRSHDAVVALVRAAATAKSTDPAAVATALTSMKVGLQDGVAGPALDFTTPTAVSPDDVRALTATAASPGVRPASPGTASLYWFPLAPS